MCGGGSVFVCVQGGREGASQLFRPLSGFPGIAAVGLLPDGDLISYWRQSNDVFILCILTE